MLLLTCVWGETAPTLHALLSTRSSQSNFLRARGPFAAEELVKDGQGLSATLRPDSELPHCCREGRNFSFVECQKVATKHTSARILPSEWAEHFWGEPLADHT